MADIDAELDAMIERIRKIPEIARTVAPAVADAVRAALNKSTQAGTTPDGKPWPERKRGGRALADADQSVHVAAIGPVIYTRLTGPTARHHRGHSKGGVKRQVIPMGAVPESMVPKIRAVLDKAFADVASGRT